MPAAVAFLGTAGVGISYPDAFSPAVAWFPLAPGEVYWPVFTDNPEAIRRLNAGAGPAAIGLAAIGSARKDAPPAEIVTGQYRNRRLASVGPRSGFVGGKPVADALIALPVRRLEHAPLLAGSPGIEPQAASSPAKVVAESAGRGMAANLAKARDTLTRIIMGRGHKKRLVEVVVSHTPAPKTRASEGRNLKLQILKKHERGGTERAIVRGRSAATSKLRLRKAEPVGKPAKFHTAELLRTDAGGG